MAITGSEPVPMEEKQILDVSILDTHSHESSLKLLLLWRQNLGTGNPVTANEPVIADTQNGGSNPPIIDPPPSIWKALSDYEPPSGTPAPKAIRLWDNTERKINRWYDILLVVVEKLFDDALLKSEDTPIQWAKTTYSIHTKSIHPTGKPFTSYRKVGKTGLFVNIHLSANDIRSNTKKLLHKYGVNPDTVYLKEA